MDKHKTYMYMYTNIHGRWMYKTLKLLKMFSDD